MLIVGVCVCVRFFFFSSRRRHTRLTCDWSSDMCSSDLVLLVLRGVLEAHLECGVEQEGARRPFVLVRMRDGRGGPQNKERAKQREGTFHGCLFHIVVL